MTTQTLEPTAASRTAGLRLSRFLLAFGIAAVAALLLGAALVFGLARSYDGRVLPGVSVGKVDVSGLSRSEAAAKLQAAYAGLGQGTITVKTPAGTDTVTYQQAGRGPDVDGMLNAALAAGRDGDPIAATVSMVRTIARGETVPVMVKVDPTALATRIREVTISSAVAPKNAAVQSAGGAFSVVPAVAGRGMDEASVAGVIISQLSRADAPSTVSAEGTYVTLEPAITDKNAQDAIVAAQRMVVDVPVALDPQKWSIPAATVRGWIAFGLRGDGTYGPTVDVNVIKPAVTELAKKANSKPVNPTFITDKTGKPIGVTGGKNGLTVDEAATAQNVADYLNALGSNGSPASSVQLVATVVEPKLTDAQAKAALTKMVVIGTWTTVFYSGEANGFGANIRIPARNINGTVVAPGDTFSFWQAVGPVDAAHGFKPGGVIKDGKSDHTGAMGGGICSASTTMFNAALRAGMEIVERHAHYYYIDRYPRGLDATVFMDGSSVWDMRWKNDTDYPVVIRGSSTYGTVTFQLWSVPTGRKVSIYQAPKTDIVKARNTTVYVTTRPAGQQYWAEYATDGFNTFATRVVKDASGKVIHSDRWTSHYAKVDGRLEIGVTHAPTPTPKPTPKPPAATPPPAPKPSPSARRTVRRRLRPAA